MQPQIALVLFSIAVVILLMADTRQKPTTSIALWIPLIWLAILASRSVEQWLDPGHGALSANVEEGSTVDRAVLSFLMVLATFTLARRQLRWVEWVKRNPWIFLFLLYCGISTVWSDFPAVAFKRWTRALGSVLMILVVLSEEDPITAVVTLVRRCGYILVPYSVLLIKYYRDLAVVYNQWTGEEYLAGVTTDKNSLGRLCLIAGIFALWELIITRRGKNVYTMLNRSIGMIMFVVTVWLLVKSKSATSLGAFILGCGILIGLGLPVFRTRVKYLGTAVLLISVIVVGLNESFNLAQTAVEGLGRNMTFTERTDIWGDLLDVQTNPVVGVGYDSFWLGERLERFEQRYQISEAHNGYLEVYLELGVIGLCLLAGLLFSAFWKAKRSLVTSFDYGRLRLVVLSMFLVYNLTEAAYKATTLMAFVFLLAAMEVPEEGLVARPETAIPAPDRRNVGTTRMGVRLARDEAAIPAAKRQRPFDRGNDKVAHPLGSRLR